MILGIIFYWFGWRPAQIRKECINTAFLESMKEIKYFGGQIDSVNARMDLKNKLYIDCLRYNGLEK